MADILDQNMEDKDQNSPLTTSVMANMVRATPPMNSASPASWAISTGATLVATLPAGAAALRAAL